MPDGLLTLGGKTAVITGAARGIGRACALLFARAGARIVVSDRLAEGAAETVRMIVEAGGEAVAAVGDIALEPDVVAMYDLAAATFGSVDVLVHSAAVFPKYDFLEMSPDQWDAVQHVNGRGAFLTMREAVRRMMAQGRGGSIVNISSVSGEQAVVFHNAAYGASKAGLSNMTKVAALEFGKHGIRVNAVLPGGTATEGAREATVDMSARGLTVSGPIMTPGRVPLGMMGEPDDIANACLFLAGGAAKAITGQLLVVDGGFLIS
jgi:NAD(P)-dependent dehydrogenase (short-subunit alcohol dehydrogenase family)